MIKNGVEQGHGTQPNPLGMKDLWPSASRFWQLIKPGLKRSKTQILTLSDPKIRDQEPKTLSKHAHNPVERGWADKADSRPPLRGPGGWGGDWYVWHAPDGLRARAATGLGCVQAGAQKLGVIEASYASAIIGVVDRPLFRRGGTTQPKGLISTAWASISTEVWIESASWFQTARNSERSSSRRCKCMYIHSRSVRCAPTAQ